MTIPPPPDNLSPAHLLVMGILHESGGHMLRSELKRRFVEECQKHGSPEKAWQAWQDERRQH